MLARPPWAIAALVYALAVGAAELVLIASQPSLFRAVLIADASTGWVIVLASLQGLRAVPFPPELRWTAMWCLAAGHWLAALAGAVWVVLSSRA